MISSGEVHRCPGCRDAVRADVFNAFHSPADQGAVGDVVQQQGQAECFYHPGKQAVVHCTACGRLLCSLCEVQLGGRTLCLRCIERGRTKQKIGDLDHQRMLYPNIALALAVIPAIFVFPTLITGPAAIFVALRYWKAPTSAVKRMRWRSLVAILFGAGQAAAWVFFFMSLLT
jgi:hypothetical protein